VDDAVKAFNKNPDEFRTNKKKKKKNRRTKKNVDEGNGEEETCSESTAPVIEEAKHHKLDDKDNVNKVFKRYADKETKNIDSSGLLELYSDLEIDMSDPATIIFPYHFKMTDFVLFFYESLGYFNRESI